MKNFKPINKSKKTHSLKSRIVNFKPQESENLQNYKKTRLLKFLKELEKIEEKIKILESKVSK